MTAKKEGVQPRGLDPFSDASNARRVDGKEHIQNQSVCQEPKTSILRVYIDGFNLYHAIDALKDHKLKWLNQRRLAESFCNQGEVLDEVNLFTAVLNWNAAKQKRHVNYITACKAVGVTVHEANFKKAHKKCVEFNRTCKFYEEKQTDVSIAVKMISDAFNNRFDRAILITADSDQIPTIKYIKGVLGKFVSVRFPPGRGQSARELGAETGDFREITKGRLASCLLPRTVLDVTGRHVASMPAMYLEPKISN